MSFVDAPKIQETPTTSGISMSMQITKTSKRVRFTINEKAQDAYFKTKLKGKFGKVMVGSGDDEGFAQIIVTDNEDDAPFSVSARGSTFISVGHWVALPNDKRPAASCTVEKVEGKVITIKMPTWATPRSPDGKLAPKVPAIPKAPEYKS